MLNHPGSFYGHERLATLKEEELQRAAARRALIGQVSLRRSRLRPRLAAGIRSLADRIDPLFAEGHHQEWRRAAPGSD